MKKNHTIALTSRMIEKCEALPLTRSAIITQALLNAAAQPELLVLAFRLRLSDPLDEKTEKVAYSRDTKLDEALDKLMSITKLPGEQVIRLSLEAYIYKL